MAFVVDAFCIFINSLMYLLLNLNWLLLAILLRISLLYCNRFYWPDLKDKHLFRIKYKETAVHKRCSNVFSINFKHAWILRDLLPFVQFTNCEKHPWRSVIFSSYRLKPATLLKISLLHECFSRTTFVKNVKNTHIFAQCEQFEMPLKVGS